MGEILSGRWFRKARRLGISAFLVVHIGATVLWVLPPCPIKASTFGWLRCYILPLGFAQSWDMFSPDPPFNVLTLEAEAIDVRGLRYNFAFPRQSDYPSWTAIPRHRHPKFAMNLVMEDPELQLNRMFAARHVVRQLGLTAEAFPVDVRLVFLADPCPAPGTRAGDEPTSTRHFPAGTYRFANLGEVRP
jgi:hypothetical protein